MLDLKPYVDYLLGNEIKKEEGLELLKKDVNLSKEEKNLIYAYCYPRQLLDRELPFRVQEYREKHNIPKAGSITPEIGEATLLVEAFKTDQYGRFMKHLIIAFGDPKNVFPVAGFDKDICPLCGKSLYEHDLWQELVTIKRPGTPEKDRKEYLAFGSKESSVVLCKNCMTQLIYASDILEKINPAYLDWRLALKQTKCAWEDLKL